MKQVIPNTRLQLIASLVPMGARFADVGSDHAYLPIYLMQTGRVSAALATDINEGPIRRAEMNIASASLAGKIKTRQCDGLDGVEDFSPDTVAIAGMGGELVAAILDKSDYVRRARPLLILQPMTQAAFLRKYLAENGYEVQSEHLLPDEHRIYQIIVCRYAALAKRTLSPLSLLAGEKTGSDPAISQMRKKIKKQYTDIIAGKRLAGQDTSEEENILREIAEYETY